MTSYEPVVDGHCMVLPRQHRSSLIDLTEKESHELWKTINRTADVLKETYGLDCMVLANRGKHATQSHIHIHVIPMIHTFRDIATKAMGLPTRKRADDTALSKTRERIIKSWNYEAKPTREQYKMDLITAYDRYVDTFEKRFEESFHEVAQPFFDRFTAAVNGKRVMDLGAGSGFTAMLLRDHMFDVTCVDLSSAMVSRCKEKGFDVIQGDMEEIELTDNHFDGIWAYCSLLHLKKEGMPNMVERLSRWLSKDGVLGVAFLDEGRPDESREDVSYPGVHRWFSYFKFEEIPALFSSKFEIIFKEKKSAKRSSGVTFYYLHYLMRKK